MIVFKILLNNLLNDVCEPFYEYNQYLLKKFFEYALSDFKYIEKLKNGSTGLKKNGYCPKHEQVVMTACIQSLSSNTNKKYYNLYYTEYLNFKTTFMGWRGRTEWFDFHRTVLSHFIWNEDMQTFMWTWNEMIKYLKNFKNKYPNISDWRRRWYLFEARKIKIYIGQICAASEKIYILEHLIKNNVVTNNASLHKALIKFGLFPKNNKIYNADFIKYPEWAWLRSATPPNNTKLNTKIALQICMETNSFKIRLIDIFKYNDAYFFWNFFLDLTEEQFIFINNRTFVKIINNLHIQEIPNKLKKKVFHKSFEFNAIIKLNLLKKIKFCLKDFKIDAKTIVNILSNIIINNKNIDLTKFQYLCSNIIDKNKSCKILINQQQTYWLYKLFKNDALSLITYSLERTNKEVLKKYSNNKECAICFNNIHTKSLCVLPCKHYFHKDCIISDIHLRSSNNNEYSCPICRCNIIPESIQNNLISHIN
jgi:hypothetical protein